MTEADKRWVDKLEKALRWALSKGVQMYSDGTLNDSGCGCCSGPIDPPDELADIFAALRTEKVNG